MEGKVYHGSPKGNIKKLEARVSTHRQECIYATSNKAVAMMFMGRGNGDLDTVKYTDNGLPVLVERRPGVFDKLYGKSGYIYEMDGSTFEHYDFLWEPEVISYEKSIKPLNVTYYDNIMDAMEEEARNGRMVLYRYPDRPKDIPLDNSDLIDKYIGFQERGIKGAITSLISVYPEFADRVKERLQERYGNSGMKM